MFVPAPCVWIFLNRRRLLQSFETSDVGLRRSIPNVDFTLARFEAVVFHYHAFINTLNEIRGALEAQLNNQIGVS